jgi:hypothetical protein
MSPRRSLSFSAKLAREPPLDCQVSAAIWDISASSEAETTTPPSRTASRRDFSMPMEEPPEALHMPKIAESPALFTGRLMTASSRHVRNRPEMASGRNRDADAPGRGRGGRNGGHRLPNRMRDALQGIAVPL